MPFLSFLCLNAPKIYSLAIIVTTFQKTLTTLPWKMFWIRYPSFSLPAYLEVLIIFLEFILFIPLVGLLLAARGDVSIYMYLIYFTYVSDTDAIYLV